MRKVFNVIISFLIRTFLRIAFRVEVIGKENIPKEGAYLFCANHASNWDPLFMVMFCKREMHFMAKEELFKNPFMRFLAYVYQAFPVSRGNKDMAAMKKSLQILNNGECLGLFPEGTRNGIEKNGKAQNGAAFMCLRTKTPIIPVGISSNYKFFSKVIVSYGKPLDYSEFYSKNPSKEVLNEVSDKIMGEIISLTK